MKELSALDLHYLVKEFNILVDAKIENIYQKESTLFIIFHKSGHGKITLKIMLPHFIYMTEYKEEMPEKPPHFCTILRKHLKTARIRAFEQVGFERILKLKFTTKDKTYYLIIELFSKGNIILCNEELKIVYPMTHQKWKDRIIKGGQMYKYPGGQTNTLELEEEQLKVMMETTKMDSIVTFLAKELSLGGTYAEQICTSTKIDKKGTPKKVSSKALYKVISQLLKAEKADLNKELDATLTEKTIKEEQETRQKSHKEKKSRVEKILDSQNKIIINLKKAIDENNQKGDLIYENYSMIKPLIDDLNKARKKYTWKDIKEKLKGHKTIKKIDENTGKMTLELGS